VGRGLLLAAPPLVLFAALFASADPTFERGVERVTSFVTEDLMARMALMGAFGWISAGLLRGVLPGPRRNPIARLRPPRIGIEETAVVLGLITALFATFVVLQLGYLFGIVALVPLGDMVERRRYVPRVLVVAALALTCTAVAPSLPVIAIALVVVGVTSVGAQLLIPFAATLARDDERGTVMGIVMSGVLLGVLIKRG